MRLTEEVVFSEFKRILKEFKANYLNKNTPEGLRFSKYYLGQWFNYGRIIYGNTALRLHLVAGTNELIMKFTPTMLAMWNKNKDRYKLTERLDHEFTIYEFCKYAPRHDDYPQHSAAIDKWLNSYCVLTQYYYYDSNAGRFEVETCDNQAEALARLKRHTKSYILDLEWLVDGTTRYFDSNLNHKENKGRIQYGNMTCGLWLGDAGTLIQFLSKKYGKPVRLIQC
jgi:hypothetical protein